jgi:hypothetical protein
VRERDSCCNSQTLFSLCGNSTEYLPVFILVVEILTETKLATGPYLEWLHVSWHSYKLFFPYARTGKQAQTSPPPQFFGKNRSWKRQKMYQMLILIVKIIVNVRGGAQNDPVFDLLIKSFFQLEYCKLTYRKKNHCIDIYPLWIKCSVWPPLRLATSVSLQAWMITAHNSIVVCGKIFSLRYSPKKIATWV